MINIYVQRTQARAELDAPVTSGSVGREVQFQFSDDWAGLTKTAVFETNKYKEPRQVPDSGTVEIPEGVLAYPGYQLRIGVIGKSADGTMVIPTVYADCGDIRIGANTKPVERPLTPNQAEKLQNQINTLDERVDVLEAGGGGSGGMSATAKTLLLTILRAAFYSSDQTSNIAALEAVLGSGGSSGGGGDAGGDEPTNTILAVDGDAYAVQRNKVLCIVPGGDADVEADGDALSIGGGVLVHKQADTLTIY